jgi:hypothetical protein
VDEQYSRSKRFGRWKGSTADLCEIAEGLKTELADDATVTIVVEYPGRSVTLTSDEISALTTPELRSATNLSLKGEGPAGAVEVHFGRSEGVRLQVESQSAFRMHGITETLIAQLRRGRWPLPDPEVIGSCAFGVGLAGFFVATDISESNELAADIIFWIFSGGGAGVILLSIFAAVLVPRLEIVNAADAGGQNAYRRVQAWAAGREVLKLLIAAIFGALAYRFLK